MVDSNRQEGPAISLLDTPGWSSLLLNEFSSTVRVSCMGWEFLFIVNDSLAIILLSVKGESQDRAGFLDQFIKYLPAFH